MAINLYYIIFGLRSLWINRNELVTQGPAHALDAKPNNDWKLDLMAKGGQFGRFNIMQVTDKKQAFRLIFQIPTRNLMLAAWPIRKLDFESGSELVEEDSDFAQFFEEYSLKLIHLYIRS